jgi:hypothetical protein
VAGGPGAVYAADRRRHADPAAAADASGRGEAVVSERIIHAVATGEYSDYRVNAVFERREDAETAIAAGYLGGSSWDRPAVEEITYFAAGEQPVNVPRIRYYGSVHITTGEVTRNDDYRQDDWVHPGAKRERAQVATDVRPWPRTRQPDRMELTVEGPATKRTHKVFTDALAKLRAECIEGLHKPAPERGLP